ncbi:hypothetical protein F5Y19DRAFT_422884 [Xylariaceae sp. FL1651]|nr:hypothetical protein F5Y19DRAFT_422884 [Xylariaceae sp. FL1651]
MCCGSDEDYYNVTPYRPENERPHPSVSQGYAQQHPQLGGPRRLTPEEIEKRKRYAQATAAAQKYGWPTARGVAGNIYTDHIQTPGNRDSQIEPDLAGRVFSMPGSDYQAVYDPTRPRQPTRQPDRRPGPPQQTNPLHRPQRPGYYQQGYIANHPRSVYQQPARMPPMSSVPQHPNRDVRKVPQVVRQGLPVPRKPVIQTTPEPFHAPQAARLVRKDSKGVSEFGDDDDDDPAQWRKHTVSPMQSPGFNKPGLYSQMGMSYGHNDAF